MKSRDGSGSITTQTNPRQVNQRNAGRDVSDDVLAFLLIRDREWNEDSSSLDRQYFNFSVSILNPNQRKVINQIPTSSSSTVISIPMETGVY